MHALAGLKLFLTIDDCHDICKRYDIMFYCHGPVRKNYKMKMSSKFN
jgi:hypothetical protein